MNQVIKTEIIINASLERVWDLLTDLASYSTWNPFIVKAKGTIKLDQQLMCQPHMPGGRKYTFKPTVTRCEIHREFAWTGKVMHSSLASGEHIFKIVQSEENQVKLIHDEIFTGVLAPLYVPLIREATTRGFIMMNQALKDIAEN